MDLAEKIIGEKIGEVFRRNSVGMEGFNSSSFEYEGRFKIGIMVRNLLERDLAMLERLHRDSIKFWISIRGGMELRCTIRICVDTDPFSSDYQTLMTVMTLNVLEYRHNTMEIGSPHRYQTDWFNPGIAETNPFRLMDRVGYTSDRTYFNYRDDRGTSLWNTGAHR